MARYDFASDNTAGAAPEAMEALIAANAGFTAGYGKDTITARAADMIRDMLDCDAPVHFTSSGTASNAIALQALCKPFEAVLAHEHAHVCLDETGAPGFFGHGLGLIGLPGPSGKIDPAALERALAAPEAASHQSPAALSLTNATEYGAVYTDGEIARLSGVARAKSCGVHLDGARLANAAAAGFDLRQLKDFIDILVIGGTKAGMPPTEAVVLFNGALSKRFDARLKQGGQLPSKARFLSAPWIGMLESGAWIARAGHANAMAARLAALMPWPVRHPVEANALFVEMPDTAHQALTAKGWNVYPAADGTVRFMCSWATTEALVDELGAALKSL